MTEYRMPNPSAWYLNSAWSKGIARGRVSVRQTAQAECESAHRAASATLIRRPDGDDRAVDFTEVAVAEIDAKARDVRLVADGEDIAYRLGARRVLGEQGRRSCRDNRKK